MVSRTQTTEPAETSFGRLLCAHDALDAMFAVHQEMLLLRRVSWAVEVLEAYQDLLRLHMRHEEELLFPIFERPPAHPRWPLVLYTGQHKKMLALLERILEALRNQSQDTMTRAFVIRVLELETTYKHLGEHHDGAERQGFFPALDAKSSDTERTLLVERCLVEWEAAVARSSGVLARARRRLDESP